MSRRRVLFLDTPFAHEAGGDKNRSRFLWSALQAQGGVDWACIRPHPPGSPLVPKPLEGGVVPVVELPANPGRGLQSESVLAFTPAAQAAFDRTLADGGYDLVLARFHAPWELCRQAATHAARPAVAVDLDMVSSRLVALAWRQEPTFRRRWFLFEKWKLERLERRLLEQPWLVWFSNAAELEAVAARVPGRRRRAVTAELPNVMPASAPLRDLPREPVILFFGSLNSSANLDAFRYLMDDLFPRLEADLRRHGVTIRVVGKNPPAWFAERVRAAGAGRIELAGAVDSMERAIAAARFVFLPLRVASGTRTRILEAAAQERAVVTTTIGAEGIDVGDGARVRDTPEALADAVRELLAEPALADRLGQKLHARCVARYTPDAVAGKLAADLDRFLVKHAPEGGA
ncbi:MAG: glycosyltransferase [Verrucomicrobiales bacterium]|nr:glycosyltransferase [Verrucomicrobiales bacterium]MCP5526681.1 glycosyltransferase [Verrucomicrobiales bacterium]